MFYLRRESRDIKKCFSRRKSNTNLDSLDFPHNLVRFLIFLIMGAQRVNISTAQNPGILHFWRLSLSLSGFLWWVPSQHSQHQLRPHLGFMNKIRGWDKQDSQTLPVSHSGDKIAPGIKINISSCNFVRSPSKIFMLFLVFLVLINC